ncbi:MAG: hypothetical protein DWQ34_03230 [Planctomycetota bacterium]|nr:MAG: hypothetical protein DWQ29_09915 [Planctomycetota bacterium]REJ96784.1 MAG: hypothetical protein DWQ34_03230 [Planctomycetota bacterium]REK21036.1 MAG: hypothetical protein DWQ41_22825 [Planctomycetota bacterium]REK38854.1 MAG: hypothetical protein DWQ45_03120 [Planctomycetota bacterium]
MNPIEEYNSLTALFPQPVPLVEKVEYIPASATPEPYKSLLVHDKHMTVTMEQYHGCPVDVHVLERRRDHDLYSRKITLTKTGTDKVIQFGLVRFDFQYVDDQVRDEIVSEAIPLGRVLINHNVLRHVDLNAILKVTAGPGLAEALQMPEGGVTYGRVATIFCNEKPAIDLLEISAPLE